LSILAFWQFWHFGSLSILAFWQFWRYRHLNARPNALQSQFKVDQLEQFLLLVGKTSCITLVGKLTWLEKHPVF
jgi:hypothetical protein